MKNTQIQEKSIPHPWAFGESANFKNAFTWPEFDFDLNEEVEDARENDALLTHLGERLVSKTSHLEREH